MKRISEYHNRTKHHPRRFARSPAFLDWENQPDPFRRFSGADMMLLPFLKENTAAAYTDLFERKRNSPHAVTLDSIGALLECSLALSAWKSIPGSSWALRINPSSGNLHPTEAYLFLPSLTETQTGGIVCHYSPYYHALEIRAVIPNELWDGITEHFGPEVFLVALSSVHWRESWKYGERAFRYCQHDLGHALSCLGFSANLLGWRAVYLSALSTRDIETILGFPRIKWRKFEEEHAGPLLLMHRSQRAGPVSRNMPAGMVKALGGLDFAGAPNVLSSNPVQYRIIDEASLITEKPDTPEVGCRYGDHPYFESRSDWNSIEIIRKRRSALDFDGKTTVSRKDFLSMLDRTIPRNGCAPFDMGIGGVSLNLLIFVHRVAGLDPGLYILLRNIQDFRSMSRSCRSGFLWQEVRPVPGDLPLYLLERGNFMEEAIASSCDQDIAGTGVFSAAMIARFQPGVTEHPYYYRLLHWEAGMIGQVLYLAAEACSLRATGMGCFFDDLVHEILGFRDDQYQDLYHFTVGGPVEDPRLSSHEAYQHLARYQDPRVEGEEAGKERPELP